MALPRSSRARAADTVVPIKDDSDSEGDTELDEEPTPKHPRTHSRKRLSDALDASFVSDSGKPRKSVNMNDDAAEKRKRRQSARIVPLEQEPEAGPSNDSRDERDTVRSAALAKQKSLATVDQAPVPTVPFDVMNANYEEWMKMATDNKINTANTWNFALIDYFHDMSLLRNNTDNSINFQRASCTLDGCVKIWTSRVDSVGTETGKLLNNLANEGRVGEDDDEDGEGGVEGEGGAQKKKKTHRPASTLAKDAAQLRNKKPELEFRVDPLFRKTCADFDEGGAHGLLMNHLSLCVGPDGGLRVVFDAGDSLPKDGEELPVEEPLDEVDLSYLRKTFLPDLDALESKAISSSLYDFSFSKDAFSFDNATFFVDDPTALDDDDEPAGGDDGYPDGMDVDGDMPGADGQPQAEDFFVGDQAAGDDYVNEYDPASPNSAEDDPAGGENGEEGGDGSGSGPYVPFDPRRGATSNFAMAEQAPGEIMFDYFDQSVKKNWAGPEHWKLRRAVRKPEAEAAPKQRREKKEAFRIDFITPSEKDVKEIAKELFAPPAKANSILLPGASTGKKAGKSKKGKGKEKEDKRDNQTLPDDMHFSSRQLVTLFLKPKFSLQMRGNRGHGELDDRHEVDEAFWAQAAADRATGRDGEEDATQGGGTIPFNTQFFHDDDDGGGFDDVYDGEGGEAGPSAPEEEQDLLAATQGQTRRVRPEFVNYAKRAKRVDVRKLKDNIWKNLDIIIPEPKGENADDDDAMETDEPPATDPSEARTFETVITGLKQTYPRDKMEEISTSFCFICLLHLANEQGLKLENGAAPMVEAEEVKKVGDIWDLKIYRDPHATQSA